MSPFISAQQLSPNWSVNHATLNALKRGAHLDVTYLNLLYYLQRRISLTPAECMQQTANSHN